MKKYLTVLCDGMADYADERGLTPMDEAEKPTMDALCAHGLTGLVKTVPDGMKAGSDVCNLAALGYDPRSCYTGRSPLEALSMRIPLGDGDVTFRTNLVTLSDAPNTKDRVMLDYSAGEITTEEARALISSLRDVFAESGVELYAGVSYRHAAVIRNGSLGTTFTPPHDILDKNIASYLPTGKYGELFRSLIEKSIEVLKSHPVNAARKKAGKRVATSVWFWGEGTKPKLENYYDKFGKTATVISAVDLVKGIGVAGGMTVVDIPTATGTVDTDYEAKTAAAINAFAKSDYVFVHLEGPDECGHQGDRAGKIRAIEQIDAKILKPIVTMLEKSKNPFAVSVMPDHATPLSVRTHTAEPIPFMIYDSEINRNSGVTFSEKSAASTGIYFPRGAQVVETLFGIDGKAE